MCSLQFLNATAINHCVTVSWSAISSLRSLLFVVTGFHVVRHLQSLLPLFQADSRIYGLLLGPIGHTVPPIMICIAAHNAS